MKIDWTPLQAALGAYRSSGLELGLWWRDDDATRATPALDRLERLAGETGIQAHLAVIPEPADESLVAAVHASQSLVPMVHGWRHLNHAPENAKKSEFGTPRAGGSAEVSSAMSRAKALFGARLLEVFVPPWNRFDPVYLPALTEAGFRGLSTFTPRPKRLAAPGLLHISTHIDPIDWRGTRGLKDTDQILKLTVDLLDARRRGEADAEEPLGYLTHHLVHDDQLWEFSRQFLLELRTGGAIPLPVSDQLEMPE